MNRRVFLKKTAAGLGMVAAMNKDFPLYKDLYPEGTFVTVNGEINPRDAGIALTHEHILVDFTGAKGYDPSKWNRKDVISAVRPFLDQIISRGCSTFVDCTPEYIGRDPLLLKELSDITGLNILTNTGFYGARNNLFLPAYAMDADAETLAGKWTDEFFSGIGNTGIKPGFIKTGVDDGHLSAIHAKLIKAAALTHLRTGLTIASHTGSSVPAGEELNILAELGISPEAFIWVHAQVEKEQEKRLQIARKGAWVSLDGLTEDNFPDYLEWLVNFKSEGLLNKVLVSHDAGWYSPGEPGGGKFRGYTVLFDKLLPSLRSNGFNEEDVKALIVSNPARAFGIRVRKY